MKKLRLIQSLRKDPLDEHIGLRVQTCCWPAAPIKLEAADRRDGGYLAGSSGCAITGQLMIASEGCRPPTKALVGEEASPVALVR
jgi:hypothetical protein